MIRRSEKVAGGAGPSRTSGSADLGPYCDLHRNQTEPEALEGNDIRTSGSADLGPYCDLHRNQTEPEALEGSVSEPKSPIVA